MKRTYLLMHTGPGVMGSEKMSVVLCRDNE